MQLLKVAFALIAGIVLCFLSSLAASSTQEPNQYYQQHKHHFTDAYRQYPSIPQGMLEGVAYTQTRFQHIRPDQIAESCIGLPGYHGVMGLIENGKSYFKENLKTVAHHSSHSRQEIAQTPRYNILAYAEAFHQLQQQMGISSRQPIDQLPVLATLSEIPADSALQNNFALNSFLYSVLWFMDQTEHAQNYGFPQYQINFIKAFGKQNYQVLSAGNITIQNGKVATQSGQQYQFSQLQPSPDYPPAIWDPAPSCNFSSRNGTPISAVTLHTIQGSYSGAISWFKNCNANVTSHYVLRSSDGQVTQMVLEKDKAWHVSSENPYTIGFEHEGFISNASWYTNAMYQSSADLARDVTNSGYGINPLRTYHGPACSGSSPSCQLTPCIKIKGHQHFPNQTHTDPGPNWNWELYYRLINNNPAITKKTTQSGTFTDQGGANGNYSNDKRYMVLIQPTGASSVTLTFNQFHLEKDWDFLYVYDGDTIGAPLIGAFTGSASPGSITSTGGSLLVEFRSDCGVTKPGWEASWTSSGSTAAQDSIAPTTTINGVGNWETQDFQVQFSDQDNTGGSGVAREFFQVLDFNGAEWRANEAKGFYNDNFDSIIHPEWTNVVGSWSIGNSVLHQSDESSSNTNLYSPMNQSNADAYLYHWAGKMDGSGNNRRAGLHFSCDNPSLSNRGNSYFVYARVEDDRMQIYKVTNNVFSLKKDIVFDFKEQVWYDYKVLFNRNTGRISVYVNNEHLGHWTDPSPHQGGDYISIRSGNCQYFVNDLKVYRARGSQEKVEVGKNGMARFQSQSPTSSACRIKSIVVDAADNLSPVETQDAKIDWTPPSAPWPVNDGITGENDTFATPSEISANWQTSTDNHSAINKYLYAVGTSPGDTSITAWTNNWFKTTMTDTALNLTQGQRYYVSVKAVNGAGLQSPLRYSDGQVLNTSSTTAPMATFSISDTSVCEGESIQLLNQSNQATSFQWSIPGGNPSSTTTTNPTVLFDSSGMYSIELIANGPGGKDTTTASYQMNVWQAPSASFTAADTVLTLPNAVATFVNQSDQATSYLWDFGDGQQSTDKNPWHQYTAPGLYDVSLQANNPACPSSTQSTSGFIRVRKATGIDDATAIASMRVEPNPVGQHGALRFSLEEPRTLTIRLIDVLGRTVNVAEQKQFGSGQHRIALTNYLSDLAPGLLLVELRTGQHNQQLKIINQ